MFYRNGAATATAPDASSSISVPIGHGHAEFATVRQQDPEEFFSHLASLRRYTHAHPRSAGGDNDDTKSEPTETFAFALEQHLQCTSCAGV
jgi:ubiquitin carboxyl-terminal hydrolase 5/13